MANGGQNVNKTNNKNTFCLYTSIVYLQHPTEVPGWTWTVPVLSQSVLLLITPDDPGDRGENSHSQSEQVNVFFGSLLLFMQIH